MVWGVGCAPGAARGVEGREELGVDWGVVWEMARITGCEGCEAGTAGVAVLATAVDVCGTGGCDGWAGAKPLSDGRAGGIRERRACCCCCCCCMYACHSSPCCCCFGGPRTAPSPAFDAAACGGTGKAATPATAHGGTFTGGCAMREEDGEDRSGCLAVLLAADIDDVRVRPLELAGPLELACPLEVTGPLELAGPLEATGASAGC